jgi:hypothetical protein
MGVAKDSQPALTSAEDGQASDRSETPKLNVSNHRTRGLVELSASRCLDVELSKRQCRRGGIRLVCDYAAS